MGPGILGNFGGAQAPNGFPARSPVLPLAPVTQPLSAAMPTGMGAPSPQGPSGVMPMSPQMAPPNYGGMFGRGAINPLGTSPMGNPGSGPNWQMLLQRFPQLAQMFAQRMQMQPMAMSAMGVPGQ